MRLFALLAALTFSASAVAQTPAFDPKSWKGQHAGPPTQVLTLGSAHLSQMETPVTAAMLAPLLDKLAAFKPDIITHEGRTGEQCEILRRYEARYPGMFDTYCWGTEEAEKATGLTVPVAMAEVEKTLASWPTSPTATQRRKLAATFLAANDRPSAQVQWLQLPPAERIEGDGIDAALLKILQREGAKPNETFEIAVALAARLGLQRVYAVDDHTADSIQGQAGPGLQPAIEKIWTAPDSPAMAAYKAAEKKVEESGDLVAFYRMMNLPSTQLLFINGDFGAALKQDTPELYGRQYVAWYETRNLRMVANIREAFGNKPGARVLNIVGASHKAYYDAYLDMMHEVQLVDIEAVLN
jgi:Family of unknown function (DUF5694)